MFVFSFILELLLSVFHLMSEPAAESVRVVETRREPTLAAKPHLLPRADEIKPLAVSVTTQKDEEPKGEPSQADAELMRRLRKINYKGPLRLEELNDLDALYNRIGGHVSPEDLEEVMKLNPRDLTELNKILRTRISDDWNETREMVEFDRQESEITQSLSQVDWSQPLDITTVQKLWALQDLYGFELSADEMDQLINSNLTSVDDFIKGATQLEEESAGQEPDVQTFPPGPYDGARR